MNSPTTSEDHKQLINQLHTTIANLKAQLKMQASFTMDYLDTFESLYKVGHQFTFEQCKAYVDAAQYMEYRFQRKGIQAHVKEYMGTLMVDQETERVSEDKGSMVFSRISSLAQPR